MSSTTGFGEPRPFEPFIFVSSLAARIPAYIQTPPRSDVLVARDIDIAIPLDVLHELEAVAPALGFKDAEALAAHYVNQGLRRNLLELSGFLTTSSAWPAWAYDDPGFTGKQAKSLLMTLALEK
jgi:hypothetical protein